MSTVALKLTVAVELEVERIRDPTPEIVGSVMALAICKDALSLIVIAGELIVGEVPGRFNVTMVGNPFIELMVVFPV
jgi:hypothetical protein